MFKKGAFAQRDMSFGAGASMSTNFTSGWENLEVRGKEVRSRVQGRPGVRIQRQDQPGSQRGPSRRRGGRQEEQRETEEHFQAHFTSETLQVRLRFQVCDLSFTVALDFVVCKLKDI